MTPFGVQWPTLLHPLNHGLMALPPGMLVLFVAWTLVWKGIALWRAARAGQPAWFVVLLVVNTLGILEIVYVAFFAPRRPASSQTTGNEGRGVPPT
jgi:methionyl-tRNA synthetase